MKDNEIKYDYIVDSLTSYMEIIESLQKNAYDEMTTPILYRGEVKNYYEFNDNEPYFNASAFRERPIEGYESGQLSFQKNVELFRHEVWRDVDTDTRKAFLAYAQHHGIKTNLIDFSLNPLIGLFFATEDYDENPDEAGYVYILESPVFDITSIFEKTNKTNLLDIITTNDKDVLNELIKQLSEFAGNHVVFLKKHFYKICQDYYRVFNGDEEGNISIEPQKDEDMIASIVERIALNDSNNLIMDYYDGYRTDGPLHLYYLIVLRGYIKIKQYRTLPIAREFSGSLPMIYKPIMNFKRGINQSGVFLYQNYTLSKGGFLLDKQKIEPTKSIKIVNKRNIIRSLDKIHINSKFIYGDHSSIAKYIENKHQKVRRAQERINEEYDKELFK